MVFWVVCLPITYRVIAKMKQIEKIDTYDNKTDFTIFGLVFGDKRDKLRRVALDGKFVFVATVLNVGDGR